MDFMNLTALENSPMVAWWVYNVIIPIIIAVVAGLILWNFLDRRRIEQDNEREANRIKREDERIQKEKKLKEIDYHLNEVLFPIRKTIIDFKKANRLDSCCWSEIDFSLREMEAKADKTPYEFNIKLKDMLRTAILPANTDANLTAYLSTIEQEINKFKEDKQRYT